MHLERVDPTSDPAAPFRPLDLLKKLQSDTFYFGQVPSTSELESIGLRLIKTGPLEYRFAGQTFRRTDGRPITEVESMKTIVLEKVK